MNLLLINGPNLNLLGKREPEIYGKASLNDLVSALTSYAKDKGAELNHFQSNAEHLIVDQIQQSMGKVDGVVINPAAFTHTSVAIRDAFLGTGIPFIEIHLSNVFARESFRHHSYLSDIAAGVIVGCGTKGYELAIDAMMHHLQK
ncbi:type II 3-dehydroquinate dehydratase [Glaciecola sp. 1036]|uniref:type II 3-dehydroquinate dehydratase n=1 Tax=Alteromonadaceae TaxID=72275 RepID=UPI003D00031A